MPDIAPFRGLRYDPAAIDDLASVVCPPYDVISDRQRDELEASSPYNVVRLVLPHGEPNGTPSKYTNARSILEAWEAAGVLREDAEQAIYVYEMRWEGGTTRGILAAVSLDPERGVLPHERTYDAIVGDRLELLRATETNLDTIFCVYDGGDLSAAHAIDRAAAGQPLADFTTPDGIGHSLWAISDPAAIDAVAAPLAKASVVIADGHHRWRTASTYGSERSAADGDGPWAAQMMFLVDASRFGPQLLPIHRVIADRTADEALRALRTVFDVEPFAGDADELTAALAQRAGARAFGLADGTSSWLLTVRDTEAEREALPADRSPAWRDLDVAVLHHLVFDTLLGGVTPRFVHHPSEALEEITQGRATLAFFLAPMPFEAVRAVAEAGEAMPQKSTFFVPKPVTGIVMRSLS